MQDVDGRCSGPAASRFAALDAQCDPTLASYLTDDPLLQYGQYLGGIGADPVFDALSAIYDVDIAVHVGQS